MPMKVSEIIKLVQQDGWVFNSQRGSHRQYEHPSKPGKVTIAGKPSDTVPPGTLKRIFEQAGL